MTTHLQQQVAELSQALVTLIGKFKELEASINNSSQSYNAQPTNILPGMMQQQVPTAMHQVQTPTPADAPQLKVRVALWEKTNSLSGTLTISDVTNGGQVVADLRMMLYFSQPNDRGLAMNGYILPKDQQAQPGTKMSDAALGSIFVTKNGTLSMEINLTATPVYNNLKTSFELQPNPARTSDNQPVLQGEIIVMHHFYSEATRAQLAAAGAVQQQPQQASPQTLSNLMATPGAPSDFGVLTGQLQQQSVEAPSLSVMEYLK